jgi:bilin biosynthesis protein
MGFFSGLFAPNVAKLLKNGDVDGLLKALEYAADSSVQVEAAAALGSLKERHATPRLVQILTDARTPLALRQAASNALCHSADPACGTQLLAYYGQVSQEDQAHLARAVLLTLPAQQVVPAILQSLKRQDSSQLRLAALLSAYGSPAIPFLLEVLRDENYTCRDIAARALGEIRDPQALEDMLAMLDTRSSGVLNALITALCKMGDRRAVPGLIALLQRSDTNIVQRAAEALGDFKDRRAVAPLSALLNHPNQPLRQAVHTALDKIGYQPDLASLKVELASPQALVRQEAVEMLATMNNQATLPLLLECLADSDTYLVRMAAAAARRLDPARADEAIQRLCAAAHLFEPWQAQSCVLKNEHDRLREAGRRVCARCGSVEVCHPHPFGEWQSVDNAGHYGRSRCCTVCGSSEREDY